MSPLSIRPERLLLTLLYSADGPALTRLPDGSVLLRPAAVGRALRCNSSAVYSALDTLQSLGYLDKYDKRVSRGVLLARAVPPLGTLRQESPI